MKTTRTQNLLAAAFAGVLAFIAAPVAHGADKKPNILFILTDNLEKDRGQRFTL